MTDRTRGERPLQDRAAPPERAWTVPSLTEREDLTGRVLREADWLNPRAATTKPGEAG